MAAALQEINHLFLWKIIKVIERRKAKSKVYASNHLNHWIIIRKSSNRKTNTLISHSSLRKCIHIQSQRVAQSNLYRFRAIVTHFSINLRHRINYSLESLVFLQSTCCNLAVYSYRIPRKITVCYSRSTAEEKDKAEISILTLILIFWKEEIEAKADFISS